MPVPAFVMAVLLRLSLASEAQSCSEPELSSASLMLKHKHKDTLLKQCNTPRLVAELHQRNYEIISWIENKFV